MMQDVLFKNLKFDGKGGSDFLTCAGHNLIIDGQSGGKVYMWERTG